MCNLECAATAGCNAYHIKYNYCSIFINNLMPVQADGDREFGGMCFIKQLFNLNDAFIGDENEAKRWAMTTYAEYTGMCIAL